METISIHYSVRFMSSIIIYNSKRE